MKQNPLTTRSPVCFGVGAYGSANKNKGDSKNGAASFHYRLNALRIDRL